MAASRIPTPSCPRRQPVSFLPALSCIRVPGDGRIDPAFLRSPAHLPADLGPDEARQCRRGADPRGHDDDRHRPAEGLGCQNAVRPLRQRLERETPPTGSSRPEPRDPGIRCPRRVPPRRRSRSPTDRSRGSGSTMRTSPRRWAATSRPRCPRGRALPGTRRSTITCSRRRRGRILSNVGVRLRNDSGRDCPLGIDCTTCGWPRAGKVHHDEPRHRRQRDGGERVFTLWGNAPERGRLASPYRPSRSTRPRPSGSASACRAGVTVARDRDHSGQFHGPVFLPRLRRPHDGELPRRFVRPGLAQHRWREVGGRHPRRLAEPDRHRPAGQLRRGARSAGTAGRSIRAGASPPGGVVESAPATPASSAAPCNRRRARRDAQFEYRCVAANRWKRAALQDF